MHFVSMAALTLKQDGQVVTIMFNKGLTIISLISVILFTLIGFFLAKDDKLFATTPGHVLELALAQATGAQLKKKFTYRDVIVALIKLSPQHYVMGGCFTAVGIGIMHYVGMIGMMFDGKIHWNAGVIVFSVVLAILVACIAFWVLFRLLSTYHSSEPLRMIAALIFAVAECSVHYTGMAAATYFASSRLKLDFPSDGFSQEQALTGALIATFFVAWCIVLLIFSDLRHANQVLNNQIMKAEDVLAKVKIDKRLVGATASIINKYKFFKPTKASMLATHIETNAVDLKEQHKADEIRAAMAGHHPSSTNYKSITVTHDNDIPQQV
jgi:NO-binding membrane sensor protein with MHYT domain